MEVEWTKLLDNGSRVVAKQQSEGVAGGNGFGEKCNSRCSGLKSSVRKRKRADACNTCYSPCVRKSALKYYSNFIESSLPNRILFFENSKWNDFSPHVVEIVRKHFQMKNTAIEVKFNECHYLLDVLYMIQWDLETGLQKQIAWIDEEGHHFFPEILLDGSAFAMPACQIDVERDPGLVLQIPEGHRDIKLQLQIDIKGAPIYDLEGCVEESNSHAKRIKITRKSLGGHDNLGIDPNLAQDDQVSEEVDGECQLNGGEMVIEVTPNHKFLEPATVRDIFLIGMQLFGCAKLLEMMPCSGHFMQSRMELFAKQVEITTKNRGDPNVRYAWLATNKDASSSLMMYGLGADRFTTMSKVRSPVHLTPVDDPYASAKNCAADMQGLQYLVLCRVILGNVELVNPTSDQYHPTSQSFDNGVDNLQNPSLYIVWSMNASIHIFPEYLITFKITQEAQGTLLGKETNMAILGKTTTRMPNGLALLHHFPSQTEGISPPLPNNGTLTSQNEDVDQPTKVPRSPWMPFPLLFEAISEVVSPRDMEMVNVHYQLFMSKKITRDEFIQKLRSIVGDGLLRSSILSLRTKLAPGSSFNAKVPKQERKC